MLIRRYFIAAASSFDQLIGLCGTCYLCIAFVASRLDRRVACVTRRTAMLEGAGIRIMATLTVKMKGSEGTGIIYHA